MQNWRRRSRSVGAAASLLPCLLALAVILSVGFFHEIQTHRGIVEAQRAEVRASLDPMRARIEAETEARIAVLHALAGVIAADPDIDEPRFSRLAERFLQPFEPGEIAIAASRDARATLVHPPAAAPPASGPLPQTRPDRDGREIVLVLPLPDPAQGAGRLSMRLDLTGILRRAEAEIAEARLETVVTPLVPEERPWDGTAVGRAADPVSVVAALPQESLRIWARPEGGWSAPGLSWHAPLIALAAIALLLGPVLQNRRLGAKRRRSLAMLRERKAELVRISRRLDLALATSEIGAWSLDFATGRLDWDRRTEELYDLVGTNAPHDTNTWRRALHPEDRARAEAEIDAAIEGDGRYRSTFRILRRDGAERHMRANGLVFHEAGRRAHLVGVHWDVTADVERNVELEAKRLEAEAASVAKSQFLANMSHEIRTPLNGMLGMLDLLIGSGLQLEQRDRAQVARSSARHLLAVLNDILEVSRIEARAIALAPEPVDVAVLAREVAAMHAEGAAARGIELAVRAAPDLPERLVCDPTRLRQVLMNLIGNAVKFTDTGEIEVTLAHRQQAGGGRLAVRIRDTGIGISAATRERLFKRFAQGDASFTRSRGGSGLGLAISRQLVEIMGGEIDVDSVEGLGSTFSFEIAADPALDAETIGEAQASFDDPGPLNILVAEDNATNQQILRAYLGLAGHTLHIVGNGSEAVAEVARGNYDLVLMDVQMPVMDGIAATRLIRALPSAQRTIPIIALTANALPGDRETFIEAGMDDHVGKPISRDALFAAIAAAAARANCAGTGAAHRVAAPVLLLLTPVPISIPA